MEESLGVLLVERGQRFRGFTTEGEKVLEWAQHVISDYDGLRQNLSEMRSGLVGQLRIGAIPVTLPIISLLTTPFAKCHPRTNMVIRSLTSIEIQRGLDDFSLDIGVTYLDNEPLARVRRFQLYMERYVLLTRKASNEGLSGRAAISWSEAAAYPLCLLTSDMQNRAFLTCTFTRRAQTCMMLSKQTRSSLYGRISTLDNGQPLFRILFFRFSVRWRD